MSDKPRKRKDKKKKDSVSDAAEIARKLSTKEDSDVGESTTPHPSGVQSMGPDDVQLHVHKDHGTGGHWCAKIVFFSLLAILAGLVGLIILENRGLSDVDTPLSESRFSEILEGWVEENRESHDDHEHDILASLEELEEHDEHGEPFEEEEDDHDEDHDHDDEDDDDHDGGEEDDDEDQQDEDDNQEDDEDQEDEEQDQEDDDEQDPDDDEDQNVDDGASEEIQNDTADNDDDDENDDDAADDDENQTNEEDDDANDEDDDNADDNEEENDNNDNDDEDDDNDNDNQPDDDDDDDNSPFEEHPTINKSNPVPLTQTNDTLKTETVTVADLEVQIEEMKTLFDEVSQELGKPSFSELKDANQECPADDIIEVLKLDDDGSFEEVIDNDAGEDLHLQKLAQKDTPEPDEDDDLPASPSSSLAEKILIGLALVVVAHSVLLRKTFNKGKAAEEAEVIEDIVEQSSEDLMTEGGLIDMRRRLTIGTEEEPLLAPEDDVEYEEYEDEVDEMGEEEVEDEEGVEDIEEYEEEDEVEMPPTFEELNAMYRPKIAEPEIVEKKSAVSFKTPEPIVESRFSEPKIPEPKIPESKISEPKVPGPSVQLAKQLPEPVEPIKLPEAVEEYEVDEEDIDPDDVEYDEEDYEGSDYEAEELSDVDDTDLMKRLEEKYGKLPHESDKEDDDEDKTWTKIPPRSGAQGRRDDLKSAHDALDDNPRSALNAFERILRDTPQTPEALYGRAKALDRLSEIQQSNVMLRDAIAAYEAVLKLKGNIDDDLFTKTAMRCINRIRFLGLHTRAISVHEALIERFDDEPEYRNELAITHLLLNQLSEAKLVLHHTLLRWRDNPIALVHYGFVLKTLDQDYEGATLYLSEGIESNAAGTQDGRFYFSLGDSLQRLGRHEEARQVFRKGAERKLFLSEYQRSLYNVDTLKSKPFWSVDDTKSRKLFETLERNWELIRDEGSKLLSQDGFFVDEAENLKDRGEWKQFDLFVKGQRITKHCQKAPITCNIMESFPAARFCTRGQIKFSVMHPGTHIWPHCGPTNCRIRAHLGLRVPQGTFIRVASEMRSWHEGRMLIFDDSFEHEVWHNGTDVRLVLIVDIWHPDLTEEQRKSLHPI